MPNPNSPPETDNEKPQEATPPLTVKVSIPGGATSIDLSEYLGNAENRCGNVALEINNPEVTEASAWLIIDDVGLPQATCLTPPDCVAYLTAETFLPHMALEAHENRQFLDQFHKIYSCHPVFRDNAERTLPFQPWMINANHNSFYQATSRDIHWLASLRSLTKSNEISVICSNKTISGEHLLRLRFVEALKEKLGDRLHWYGNGINPLNEKWQGIAPYKYHLAIENTSRPDFITEKLYDSYLGLAFPIYSGAPNVNQYFPSESILSIDISDPNTAIMEIVRLLERDPYQEALSNLLAQKDKVLNQYNAFKRIGAIGENLIICSTKEARPITLFDRQSFARSGHDTLPKGIVQRLRRRLVKFNRFS